MSVSSGFFNSVDGDRKYDAVQFSSIFDGMINDGVFEDFGDAFAVTPGVGLSVIIGTGRCWFNHTWTYNSTPITMTLDSSSPDGSRWDAIALKIDHSEEVRENSIIKVNGAVSSNPTKPTFTPTSNTFYYPLAYVKVNQSASSIGVDNIDLVVGTDACPYATIVSSGVNFDVLGIEKGGTGNTDGYIRTGMKAGSTVGLYTTMEGQYTQATRDYAHAEGYNTEATMYGSHAEGNETKANAHYGHAEGSKTTVEGGTAPHAEGYSTKASDQSAHAEGTGTLASASAAHAEGWYTTADGRQAHATGDHTIAHGTQTVVGKYNRAIGSSGGDYAGNSGLFMVGSGTSDSSRANCFRAVENKTYGMEYTTSGADYAEMFEWKDGNPYEVDRIGLFVTMDGPKIRLANSNDDYILGIVSGNAAIVGDEGDEWNSMHLRDIYGRFIYEEIYIEPEYDDEGHMIREGRYETVMAINPDYDPSKEYIHRKDRPEWAMIGMLGKLVVIDDGTAVANGYVYPGQNGVATNSSSRTKFRVIERIDSTHIRVMVL